MPERLATRDEIKKMESQAFADFGISPLILMENAGEAVFNHFKNLFLKYKSREFDKDIKILIVAGAGNNGGDSFVLARFLFVNEIPFKLLVLGSREKFKEEALVNFEILENLKVNFEFVKTEEELSILKEWLLKVDIIIDAIFGTGLEREIKDFRKHAINLINDYSSREGKIVLAIDTPSGLDVDRGTPLGAAVKASYTITFGMNKLGFFLYPGYEYTGKIIEDPLTYPGSLRDSEKIKVTLIEPPFIEKRKSYSHKGEYGKVFVIAGSKDYIGAPYFASVASLKVGSGMCYLGIPLSLYTSLASKLNEVILKPFDETASLSLSIKDKEEILEIANSKDAVLLGPGLSLNEETQKLVLKLALFIEKPLIIDGDGLTAIKRNISVLNERKAPTILTPHMGEFSRLTDLSIQELEEDPVKYVREFSSKWKSVIVLKGYHAIVADLNSEVSINTTGNPGMAVAGSGDVLSGIILSFLGKGFSPFEAAKAGVYIHGLAGDIARDELGEEGLTPTDILNFLPFAIKKLKS